MFGLFKSAEARRRKRESDLTLVALHQQFADASREIDHAIQVLDAKGLRQVAGALRGTVICCERTVEAVAEYSTKAARLFEMGGIRWSLGEMLGTRLVISGVLLSKQNGLEWIDASLAVTRLDGLLQGFVQRNGVEPWPVMYIEDVAFERFRRDHFERVEIENRAFEAE